MTEPTTLKKPWWPLGAALKDTYARCVYVPGYGPWLVGRGSAYRVDELNLKEGVYKVQARKLIPAEPEDEWKSGYAEVDCIRLVAHHAHRPMSLDPDLSLFNAEHILPGCLLGITDRVALNGTPAYILGMIRNQQLVGITASYDPVQRAAFQSEQEQREANLKAKRAQRLMKGMPV